MRQTWGKISGIAIVIAVAILPLLTSTANAAQLTNRKLTLVANGAVGGSTPAGTVNHQFTFNVPTAGTLGSIKFEYCTTASVATCVAPTDMDATGATFGNETGSAITGFSMGAKTANSFVLTRAANSISGGEVAVLQANGVLNPSPVNYTFFVRITTYASTDASGSPVDSGTVAATTAEPIVLTGVMPESLIFCTGETVSTNCTSTTPGDIAFDQLFSPTDTSVASSQMAASTNAGTGYVITVNGPTLTSGSNTIPGWTTPTEAGTTRGISNWGMNLVANTATTSATPVGANLTTASNGTDLKGQPTTDYGTADNFKFVSGDVVANSAFDGASNTTPGPTNSQVYTASYAVNVAGNQLAGTYVSTLTYICTPTF